MPEPKRVTRGRRRESISQSKETLTLLTREILARKASAAKVLYEVGARLNRVNDEQLYEAGGYSGFGEYLERGVKISSRSAFRFMRIARHFNARIAARYGSGKLDAALRYMEATPQEERPGDLLSAQIRIRDEGGKFVQRSLHEASESEIRVATQLLVEAKRGGLRIPKAVQRKSEALSEALPPPPAGLARTQRVKLTRGRDGRLAATFSAIPLDEMDDFLRAVREHLAG